MEVSILKKGKPKDKNQKTHYPKCPSCGNENYLKLSACHTCNSLVCESCKGKHN
jgi:hypothetical protein